MGTGAGRPSSKTHKSALQRLVDLGCVGFGATSKDIRKRIDEVEAFDLGDWWGDRIGKAKAERARALALLQPQLQQAEQSERQAAELAELKHQQAEEEAKRLAEEAERQAEQDAKERADREAEEAKAQQDREAELAQQRKAEAERKQREEAKRRDDEAHHDKVISDAVAAITTQTGIPTIQAAAVVQLIEAGQVPNITLHF